MAWLVVARHEHFVARGAQSRHCRRGEGAREVGQSQGRSSAREAALAHPRALDLAAVAGESAEAVGVGDAPHVAVKALAAREVKRAVALALGATLAAKNLTADAARAHVCERRGLAHCRRRGVGAQAEERVLQKQRGAGAAGGVRCEGDAAVVGDPLALDRAMAAPSGDLSVRASRCHGGIAAQEQRARAKDNQQRGDY